MKAIVIENIEGPLSMQYLDPMYGASKKELESLIDLSVYIKDMILSCLNREHYVDSRDQLIENLRYAITFYRCIRYLRNKDFDNLHKLYLVDLKKETEIVLMELELIHKTMFSWIRPMDIY